MTGSILDGVRILDLNCGLAGRVAAMLLAEVGADVVRVESGAPDDDPGRLTWDRSKRSVALDPAGDDGATALRGLLQGADVLIHELSPVRARALGLDDDTLLERHPRLVVCSVLAWPANHPAAETPVDELLAMARLGICDEQMPVRRDGPMFVRFPLGSWGAVYLAATGVVARLLVRRRTGRGGVAHTSLVQGAMVPMGMHWSRAENPSPALAAGMPKLGRGSQASLFECSDGRWIHLMRCADDAGLMKQALAEMGADAVAAANAAAGESAFGYPNRGANIVAMRQRPSDEWLADFWANDIAAQPALRVGDVLDDEQARLNGYVVDLDDPRAGRISVPGLVITVDPPQRIVGPAPDPGRHTEQVLAEWSAPRPTGADAEAPAAADMTDAADRPRHPLQGVKVLDLGNFLAGPYAPMLMADLGAEVVKIEATHGDSMRAVGWAFAGCQRGKLGVALDMKSAVSRPALEALIAWADVVHHNLRMPAARKLRIDYDTVRAINPDVVYCHTSSYGPQGPRSNWPGYDQLFQAQCGWEVVGAGEGNPPMWHRFGFMDHQCALSSLLATLLALYERDRTGRGQAVAASLLGAGVLTASETYRRADGTLTPYATLDADQTSLSTGSRIARVADGWIAIASHGDAAVGAVCRAVGVAGADDLAAALADRTVADVTALLAPVGVACERVRENNRDAFLDDPDNRAAGLVAEYPHAEWGTLLQPGAMWHFGDLDVRLDLAPPALGEHTDEVLRRIGLSADEIDGLVAAGAVVVHSERREEFVV